MADVNKRQKNGEIEFFRFLFSIIIVLHHSRYLIGDKNCPFLGGALAVEFFFILSGCLMAQSIEKERIKHNDTYIGRDTFCFIKRKVKGFFPQILFAWGTAFAVTTVASNRPWKETVNAFINGFWELTVIKMFGISTGDSVNGVVWYISSMLLCMFFLYPLIKKFPDIMYNIAIPLIVLLGYGWLCQMYGSPRGGPETYKVDIRALAGICTGIISFQIAIKLRYIRLNNMGKAFLSAIKWGCYGSSVVYMHMVYATKQDYFYILLIAIAVAISFSQQGIESGIFQKNSIIWLGRFSLYLYLTHVYWAENLNTLFTQNMDNMHKMFIYLAVTFINAYILWKITDFCKKNSRFFAVVVRKLFVKSM